MFIEDKADGHVEFEDTSGNVFQTENEEAKAAKKTKQTEVTKITPGSFLNGKLYK